MCFLSFNNCCRCCNRQIRPFPPTPSPSPMPILGGNLAARFNTVSPIAVAGGVVIPLTNTVFNNADRYIQLNNNAVSLSGEGLYLVNYSATITNTSENTVPFTVNLNVNGAADASASAVGIIPADETGTVSNSSLIYVPANSTSTLSLSLTSEETLSVLPNIVITKLS